MQIQVQTFAILGGGDFEANGQHYHLSNTIGIKPAGQRVSVVVTKPNAQRVYWNAHVDPNADWDDSSQTLTIHGTIEDAHDAAKVFPATWVGVREPNSNLGALTLTITDPAGEFVAHIPNNIAILEQ